MTEDDLGEHDDGLGLRVLVSPILAQFDCPICMSTMTDPHMTPCGHNFCRECIMACLNRKHQCPCCKNAAVQGNTVKNRHLDSLIAQVVAAKDAEARDYFEKMFKQSGDAFATQDTDTGGHAAAPANVPQEQASFSPVQQLFRRHMKRSLILFEEHQRELDRKLALSKQHIRQEFAQRMAQQQGALSGASPSPKGDPVLQRLQAECEAAIISRQAVYDATMAALLQAYDKFMGEAVPPPTALPVEASVRLHGRKDTEVTGVTVQPDATAATLRTLITTTLAEHGHVITSVLGPTNVLAILRPFQHDNERTLMGEDVPLSTYGPEYGMTIEVLGEVALKEDEPTRCFKYTREAGQMQDYWTCQQCSLNWICQACVGPCHTDKGHTVVPYLKSHKPTWACCYCAKKVKSCALSERRRKKQR